MLKTLKDIDKKLKKGLELHGHTGEWVNGPEIIANLEIVRQEAIKWIKEGTKDDEYDTWFDKFKEFHNITEEDLK